MFDNRCVAVVVPAWNEADKIARALRAIPDLVDRVIVVDDGSRDGTAAIARAHARRGLEVIALPDNVGVGAAIATGYRRALALHADLVAVMAGDAQMDPEDLPALLAAAVRDGTDYIKGDRFGGRTDGRWPALRLALRVMPLSRLCGNLALSWLTGLATGTWRGLDSQCGYTVANRRALAAVLSAPVFPRYGYPNALLIRLCEAGLSVGDVPVRPIYGDDWRSGLKPWKVAGPIALLLLGALLRRVARRLRGAFRTAWFSRPGLDA